jgi:sporulation protein YlmC with PRC-barrel domain
MRFVHFFSLGLLGVFLASGAFGAAVATPGAEARTALVNDIPAVRAHDLLGVNVRNAAGEHLGKIEDMVVDPTSGKIRYAVLSFGGFLGMGNKLFAVPWDELKLVPKGTTRGGTQKEEYYILDVNKQALRTAPGFDKKRWPDFADPNWATDVDKFYRSHRTAVRPSTTR